MANIFRWIVLTICVPLLLALLQKIWGGVLDRAHVADTPWEWFMGWLEWFANLPGVFPGSLIATGLVVGVSADWLLRKFDGSRALRRRALGVRFCSLAGRVEERFNGYYGEWPNNIHDLKPAVMSAFIEVETFGLWAPVEELHDREDGGRILINYLRIVGTMLRDGHFKQAKIRALQVRGFVAPATTPAISP